MEKAVSKKVDLEKRLWEEIKGLEDIGYAMFEKGFDKAIAQDEQESFARYPNLH